MKDLGTLKVSPVSERSDLVAPSVAEMIQLLGLGDRVGIAEIDPALSDTAAFCEHYGVSLGQSANCIVLEAKRGERSWFAACVILGNTRADINGAARKTLDARKVSFAPMEEAVSQSGMEYGAITPVGLPEDWSILVDKKVTEMEHVIIGSGLRKSKIVIPGNKFLSLPNVQIIENLAQAK